MSSVIKTLIFTVLVPGTVTVVIPYRLLGSGPKTVSHFGLIGASVIALGLRRTSGALGSFPQQVGVLRPPLIRPKSLSPEGYIEW